MAARKSDDEKNERDEKRPVVDKMIDREEAAPLIPGENENDKQRGGKPVGHQETVGGGVYREGRLVGYTDDEAISATEGGIKDPTIQPGTGTVTDPIPGAQQQPGQPRQSTTEAADPNPSKG